MAIGVFTPDRVIPLVWRPKDRASLGPQNRHVRAVGEERGGPEAD